MDKDYFMNAGISPWSDLNCASDQSLFDHNGSDQFSHFDSSSDVFAFRELIGKLGGIGGSSLASPESKLTLPVLDHQMSAASLGNSAALAPPFQSLAADPGFAERAAKFSCFGSRSFSGRTSQLGLEGNGELGIRSNSPLAGNGKLSRVLSSPALEHVEIPRPGNNNNWVVPGSENKFSKLSGSNANSSNEESTVSEQIPSAETGSKVSAQMNSRKRKVVSRGKKNKDGSNSAKGVGRGENEIAKRSKSTESAKIEDETTRGGSNDESEKQQGNQKPPEPPKDYIHVRARRGQATDSHSLAERVRREKISERMKLLQDLVPGCNKVTGKALMIDEIINYVQSLQRQVEFLSMKLSLVTPGLDFNMESLLSKDMFQQNSITLPQQMYPLDSSSSPAFYHQNVQQLQHNSTNISSRPMSHDGSFNETLSQLSSFNEDDLQSIVQMGFVRNPARFPVPNQISNMKVER